MARIRTIKPEAFASESLAAVSLTAERTFFGLLTQADDHGRHRDQAAIIRGLVWPLRHEHTALDVEEDLVALHAAHLICRYIGGDGKAYLHITGWQRHQKINRPTPSRLPACPEHANGARPQHGSGEHLEPSRASHGGLTEGSVRTHGGVSEGSLKAHGGLSEGSVRAHGGFTEPSVNPETAGEPAGHSPLSEDSLRTHGGLTEPSVSAHGGLSEPSVSPHCPDLGSRTLDQGSVPSGREAPGGGVCAKDLIGEYVAACRRRPPGDVVGHLGRLVRGLLEEGIAVEHIRAGLRRFAESPGHPSRLPSLVNEALNAPNDDHGRLARPGSRSTLPPRYQAWTNPVDAATAYAEEL